jgi:hypothetical protein
VVQSVGKEQKDELNGDSALDGSESVTCSIGEARDLFGGKVSISLIAQCPQN